MSLPVWGKGGKGVAFEVIRSARECFEISVYCEERRQRQNFPSPDKRLDGQRRGSIGEKICNSNFKKQKVKK